MTVTDSDAVTNYASPDTINTTPHSLNTATAPDADLTTAKNETSVIKLIDGQ